jgi:hypothetical protein
MKMKIQIQIIIRDDYILISDLRNRLNPENVNNIVAIRSGNIYKDLLVKSNLN